MAFRVRDAGVLRTITKLTVHSGGQARRILRWKVMQPDGNLQTVATFVQPMLVTVSPTSVSGTARALGSGARATTNAATVQPSGGVGPYSYAWQIISGRTMTINSPDRAQTTFTLTEAPGNYTATARCTVTDSAGQTGSITVFITITITDFGGGPIE